MRSIVFSGLAIAVALIAGCGSPSTSTYSAPSRQSEVMSEGQRSAVVDHMVGQGASRSDADAFTRALNEAQREWEASQ
jgi:uncharacterized lipoprotein YajG